MAGLLRLSAVPPTRCDVAQHMRDPAASLHHLRRSTIISIQISWLPDRRILSPCRASISPAAPPTFDRLPLCVLHGSCLMRRRMRPRAGGKAFDEGRTDVSSRLRRRFEEPRLGLCDLALPCLRLVLLGIAGCAASSYLKASLESSEVVSNGVDNPPWGFFASFSSSWWHRIPGKNSPTSPPKPYNRPKHTFTNPQPQESLSSPPRFAKPHLAPKPNLITHLKPLCPKPSTHLPKA